MGTTTEAWTPPAAGPVGKPRLVNPMPGDLVAGWVGPLAVAFAAFVLRLYRLEIPKKHIFDEVYYACDSQSLIRHGFEVSHKDSEKFGFCAEEIPEKAGFIVHPPLGKWLIGLGEKLAGFDSFGWRISACIAGAISVFLLCRIGRRMFRSTLLGCIAGGVLALDGLHFVQSRVAMLDIFLMLFVVAAFGCLVVDRDVGRARLASRVEDRSYPGPRLGFRGWRWAAGAFLGAAIATKWSGLYHLAALALLAFAWEVGARRTAGVPAPFRAAVWREMVPMAGVLVLLPAVLYTASWAGWFSTDGGWRRTCMEESSPWANPDECGAIRGWVEYHQEIYAFHNTLTKGHPYQSSPFTWPLLGRPVSYFYETPQEGTSQEILGIGSPAVWWTSIFALGICAWRWVSRRDWRAAAILIGYAAAVGPWFFRLDRTMFLFYALPALPFMCLALAYACGVALGESKATETRRTWGIAIVAAFLALVVANFAYLYPILSARTIPYEHWRDRMWFSSWI